MPQDLTRSQPDSVDSSPKHVDKKPRLDSLDIKEQHVGPTSIPPPETQPSGKRRSAKRETKKKKEHLPEPYSIEDVITRDVVALLGERTVQGIIDEGKEHSAPFTFKQEVDLIVTELSSSGESLSVVRDTNPPWVILTPFALPGETIRARVYRNARLYSHADLLEVVTPNKDLRDMSRVKCQYFGKCAGCQYQMLSYDTQLDLKRNVIVKAYRSFSDLPPCAVPPILPTIGSPLQYGYRTKITPHFDAPKRLMKKYGATSTAMEDGSKPAWLQIGFNGIGTRQVMDIEECPIATPALNEALGPIRNEIISKIHTYKKGVSLLLRESLEIPSSSSKSSSPSPRSAVSSADAELSTLTERKLCVTDHKATIRERVGSMLFEYTAGSFFQNNNSVLVPLTSYVRDAIFPPNSSTSPTMEGSLETEVEDKPTHLVDAYCGSGLFALTLSPSFEKITGIELSVDSIKSATHNVILNQTTPSPPTTSPPAPPIPKDKPISFLAGDAANIFSHVSSFPRSKTVLIIDPPRKGSDEKFIDQLVEFGCKVVVYVSCNVHTQARDIGMILRKSREKAQKIKKTQESGKGKVYILESVRGFDLFPQTAHVESVAVLRLVDADSPLALASAPPQSGSEDSMEVENPVQGS